MAFAYYFKAIVLVIFFSFYTIMAVLLWILRGMNIHALRQLVNQSINPALAFYIDFLQVSAGRLALGSACLTLSKA